MDCTQTRRTRGRDDAMRWAYTREVTSWVKQLTSLTTALALSGSQAVLTACMALCLSGVPAAAASHVDSAAVGQAAHASAPAPAVSSGHAHHAAPATHDANASADERSSSPEASAARLTSTCNSCCDDGRQVALVAGAGVERPDGHVFGVAAITPQVASFFRPTSARGSSPPSPPVPSPSPITAPLTLRI